MRYVLICIGVGLSKELQKFYSFIQFLIKVWKQFFEMLIFYNGVALAVLMNSKLTTTFFKIQDLI